MKIIILTLIVGLLGHRANAKPFETTNDATDVLVEIEKQRLIKFPEELNGLRDDTNNPNKTDEAKRILEEIEKINQALGYVKKSESARMPSILDSSQYLFPNAGYQPFHAQNPQVKGSNGETLLLPSIRSIKMDQVYHHKASEFNKPPVKKAHTQKITTKPTNPPMYFHPHRVEVPAPQTPEEKKLLPTHFVIPVRLYKNNKQQFVEKHAPQEYKVKGYKIVGDIDHFYGKTKNNSKTSSTSKVKSTPKYHLLFLPQEVIAKNAQSEIEALNATNSGENSSREEKLANRPLKLQTNTHTTQHGNIVNATSSATIVRKRVKPLKGEGSSVVAVTSGSVIKVTPAPPANGGHTQQQQSQLQHQQQQQQQLHQQQQQYQKPANPRPNNHPLPVGTPSYLATQQQTPTAVGSNGNNNNNNDNNNLYNNDNNNNKNRNPLLNPLLGLQSNLQNNINNINNATSNAIKTAFQNIFRLPFRPDNNNNNNNNIKPQVAAVPATEYPYIQAPVLQLPLNQQQQIQDQQQYYYTLLPSPTAGRPPLFLANNYQNDHLDSDYKWDDENSSTDSDKDVVASDESQEPAQEKIFGHPIKEIQQTQKEALKQGGIIIQKLKVRKGGIAIAGPGGVATAGSGGTAIVGPGGYALTHPRSLTIAGPGAKVIAIPASVDLKDALTRTNLKTKMIPREGRIVATGPTVYYAPGTADGLEIIEHRSLDEQTLPYYGGLKGQFVHVKDGKVQKFFVNGKETPITPAIARQGPTAALSHTANREHETTSFEEDFNRIQLAAARLVAIQEQAKQKGTFSSDDNRVYAASLLELGQAAQSLAKLQQTGQIQDFSVLLQPYQGLGMPQKTPSVMPNKESDDAVTVDAPVEEQKVDEVTEQQFSEADLLPVTPEDPYEDVHDSVAIMPPKKDASVAEAKPVGVSIAGEGGVASSKPNAVALSGRNGLAVSAPKATAIAGVTPQEAAAFSISLPSRNQLVIKSASTRIASPAISSSYDDYDYIESSPLQANTRNVPLLRSSGLLRTNSNSKPKPMMATANAADTIVKMWRTAIAEDYAAPSDDVDRLDDFDIEQLYKISKKLNQRRRI